MTKKKDTPVVWGFTQADLETITDKEVLRGDSRFLPPEDEIPSAFWKGNVYTRIVEALYIGDLPAHSEVQWLDGFNDQKLMMRMCLSHIRDVQIDYDHRMAGIGYMISHMMRITPILVP